MTKFTNLLCVFYVYILKSESDTKKGLNFRISKPLLNNVKI